MSTTKSIIRSKYEFDVFIGSQPVLDGANALDLQIERERLVRNGAEIIDVTEDSFTMVDEWDQNTTHKFELR